MGREAYVDKESKSDGYDEDNTHYSKSKRARPFCSQIVIMLRRQGLLAFRDPRSH